MNHVPTVACIMVAVAALIGCAAGTVAVLFRKALELLSDILWHGVGARWVAQTPWHWKLLVPALGGLATGYLIRRFAWEAKGHGVPEVIAAVATRSGRMRARVPLVKAIASAITIGSGGAAGSEGPIVQVGAGVGSVLGQVLRVGERRLRTLVGCGAAAGIAAIFNAPVAGALFAVEIVIGDFRVPQFSPIVIASVTATVVTRGVFGADPVFDVPPYQAVSSLELIIYALLGLCAGVIGATFTRLMYATEDRFEALPLHPALTTALGGLLVGALLLVRPEIAGVGYDTIGEALHGHLGLRVLATLIAVKLVGVCLTIGSGGSGGVFAPSLYLGAMTGGAIGSLAHQWLPHATAPSGAYALVGMAAMLGAVTHGPVSAMLIIFEMTNDYYIILPLMLATTLATLVSSTLHKNSMYTEKLERRGLKVAHGHDVNLLGQVSVKEVLRTATVQVRPHTPLREVIERGIAADTEAVYVVDEQGRLHGVISLRQLNPLKAGRLELDAMVAEDLADPYFPRVSDRASLDEVLYELGGGIRDEIPVVSDDNVFCGVVKLQDVIRRYNRELYRRNMAEQVAHAVWASTERPAAELAGYHVADLPAPGELIGKTIREADVRRSHGVTVLLVRRAGEDGLPGPGEPATPETVIEPGMWLVVYGPADRIAAFREL